MTTGYALLISLYSYVLVSGQDWNYFGVNDEWTWGQVAAVCDTGSRQSPINIIGMQTVYSEKLDEPKFQWYSNETDHILVYNDGKKVGIAIKGKLHVTGASLSGTYKVYGAHWHWGRQDYKGSEHLYTGRAYPMELHVVSYSNRYADITAAVTSGDASALAVFGTMYQISDEEDLLLNKVLSVFDKIKMASDSQKVQIESFNMADLQSPDRRKFFRYVGSLTTPGCQEKVIWTNFVIPRKITKEQLAKFRTLSAHIDTFFPIGDNYREIQPVQGRSILRSFKEIRPAVTGCDEDTVAYDTDAASQHSGIKHIFLLIVSTTLVLRHYV